jgi:hypothetical protein
VNAHDGSATDGAIARDVTKAMTECVICIRYTLIDVIIPVIQLLIFTEAKIKSLQSMNKTKTLLALTVVAILTIPMKGNGAARVDPNEPAKTAPASVRAEALVQRLEEIKALDHSALSHSEKRELRKEVRTIRKELHSNGVYLSVGAIIIIILLLILLV